MWTHDLLSLPTGIYSANSTWADLGLHASLISHFAVATHLPLDFPLAAGTHITYPFITDLLSGWLRYGGWSLHMAIFVPSVLLVTAFLQLMLGVGIRLFRSVGGTILGLTLSLLCGSAVGIFQAWRDFLSSGLSFAAFLSHLPKDYTALTSPNATLTNLVADALLPQRTFLMGFSTFAAVGILLTRLRTHPSTKLAVFTGVLVGLLPLVHSYSFLVLMALLGSFWVEELIVRRKFYSVWLTAMAASLVVAVPQLLWQSLANQRGTGGHFALGWTIEPGESLVTYWADNYGLTLVLIFGVLLTLVIRRSLRRYLAWYAPIVLIFIFANIYSIQPFAYDNHKLILYVYLFTYLFAGYGATWLIRRHRWSLVPIALVVVLLVSSGTLAVMREFEHLDQFASPDDIALAHWATTSTRTSDVFFATDRPNQPLATLAGRSLVAGYRGWLYNFNVDYQPRIDAIQSALVGELTTDNVYHAHYVAVATYESSDWTVDQASLSANYKIAYTNPSWTVYSLPNR